MFERPDDESILCVLKLRKFHCFLVQISIISLIESFFGRTSVTKLRSLLRKNWTKDVSLNLAPAALDRFENIVPNFFPTRCFVFFELSLLVSLSNLSDQRVEDIVHVAPGHCTNCKKLRWWWGSVRWPVSGAGLVEGAVELVSKWETLFSLHQSLGLLQIHLKQTNRYLQ